MLSARLPADVPRIAVHYADEVPFRSLMDLDPAGRAALLQAGAIKGADRYRDPTYVDTRLRVEAAMHEQFSAAGGRPLLRHPHYALLGRSARVEARASRGEYAYLLSLDALPAEHVSFTWGDSFCFDAEFLRLTGRSHPGYGRTHRIGELPEILERWGESAGRPGWQMIEVQLWFVPQPGEYAVIELGAVDSAQDRG